MDPAEQFGIVEGGVYRSNMIQPSNFSFMQTLRLRKVLLLSPEMPTRAVLSFFEDNKIELSHLGLKVNRPASSWVPMSEELVKEGLQLLLDPANHPLLVMCTSGVHQTGTFIGCLRKLQRWNFNSIVVEYRSYAGSKSRYVNEQFIERFDTDLVTLPRNLAPWFALNLQLLAQEEAEDAQARKASASAGGTVTVLAAASTGLSTPVTAGAQLLAGAGAAPRTSIG